MRRLVRAFSRLSWSGAPKNPQPVWLKHHPRPLPDDPFSESARLAKADRELNAIYSALLKRLDRSEQNALRMEQRAWVERRNQQADDAVRTKDTAETLGSFATAFYGNSQSSVLQNSANGSSLITDRRVRSEKVLLMGCQSMNTNRTIGIFALFFGFAGSHKPNETYRSIMLLRALN